MKPDNKVGVIVLFMSGYSDPEALKGVPETTDRYLQKPFAAETVLTKIRSVLSKGRRQPRSAE